MKNEEENIVEKFFSTKRGIAVLKLGGFIIFFIILSIYIRLEMRNADDYNQNNNNGNINNNISKPETNTFPSLSELRNKVLEAKYSFSTVVNINEEELTVIGIKDNDNYAGVYIDGETSIRYNKIGIEIYEINGKEQVLNNELFAKLDFNLVNMKYIFNLIGSVEPIININEKTKIYNYETETHTIEITTNKKIESVLINEKNNNITYLTDLAY